MTSWRSRSVRPRRTGRWPCSAETDGEPVTREQRRSRRKRAIRAKTISVKRMTKRELELGRMLYPEVDEVERPRVAQRVRGGDAPLPVRVLQAPPLPGRVGADRRHQAELPRPRGLGDDRDLRARRRRPRRHDARGGRRHHEPDARADPPGRGQGAGQARRPARHDGAARLRRRGAHRQAPPARARRARRTPRATGTRSPRSRSEARGRGRGRGRRAEFDVEAFASAELDVDVGAAPAVRGPRIDRARRSRYPRAAWPSAQPSSRSRTSPASSPFARALRERGVRILSSGGTAKALAAEGVAVETVESYTGSPGGDGRAGEDAPPARPRRASCRAASATRRDLAAARRARDRPRRRQPLPLRARRGGPGVDSRPHRREHRHRRPVDGPVGGEEPRPRHHRVRSGRLRARARGDRPRAGTRRRRRAPSSRRRPSRTPPPTTPPSAGTSRRASRTARGRASPATSRCPSSAPTACATARTRTRRARSTSSATRRRGRSRAPRASGRAARSSRSTTWSTSTRRSTRCASSTGRRRWSSSTPTRAASPSRATLVDAYREAREADPLSAFGGIVAAQPGGRRGDGACAGRDVPRVRRRPVVRRRRRSRCSAPRRTCACWRRARGSARSTRR